MLIKKFLLSPLVLFALWALALIACLVVRPRPWTPSFYALLAAVVVFGVLFRWRVHVGRKASKRVLSEWEARFKSVAPIVDVDDDGHLYEWLEPAEWEKVFVELEKIPKESRSLRQAMERIAPDALG